MKRIIALLLTASLLVTLCSCGKKATKKKKTVSSSSEAVSSEEPVQNPTVINTLTGCNISDDPNFLAVRPVAIMINNISVAQGVQCGLSSADIVYETLVEGGITRMLAVYKNVGSVPKIGSVRSARYVFPQLAMGHDAAYVHCGCDPNHCKPFMKRIGIDDVDLDTGTYKNCGYREKNGLASEHTEFTSGEKLTNGLSSIGYRMTTDRTAPWQSFVSESTPYVPEGGACNSAQVAFSASYKTGFDYNSADGKYYKKQNGNKVTDKSNGAEVGFRNVFVLCANIGMFDSKYVNQDLSSGNGYYISNGAYKMIKWQKGGPSDSFKFFDEAGNALAVNPGSSYVCITRYDTTTVS